MAVSDKELNRLVTCESGGFYIDVVELARELLAARKVVRAASRMMKCDDFRSDAWCESEIALLDGLAAYDKARKGKVT